MTDMRTPTLPAGWYPDAVQDGQQRYWDGQQWTEHIAPMLQQGPPMPPPPPTGSKAPVYKRPWFIALAVVFGLMVLAGMTGDEEEPAVVSAAAETDDGDAESRTDAAPAPASVSVPDVVGLDERDATAELEDTGLDVLVLDVEGAEKGEVVRQSPKAGTNVDDGATVALRVATGVVAVKVPDVTGMKLADGEKALRAKGFNVDVSKKETKSTPVGEILEQSPTGKAEEGETIALTVAKAPKPVLTSGQENALRSAENYLGFAPFSRQGLIEQLEYEEYSTADATFAVDHVSVDWNEQAAKAAKNYLDMSPFSRQGLIEQLEYEGYTNAQATYGVDQAM